MLSAWIRLLATLLALVTTASSMAQPRQWYRGNTHTHTLNSDGDSAPDEVARWYRKHGYQFLFITDHEYLTDVAPLNALVGADDRFLVLPGQEVTQWSDDPTRHASRANDLLGAPAHINALFAARLTWPVGLRKCSGGGCGASAPASMPIGDTFKANIDAIRAQGAIAQINHPNGLWALKPTDLVDTPDGTLIEIWNAADPFNLGGDDGNGDVRPSAEGFWDWLLTRGKVVWGVGSDDSHHYRSSAFTDAVKTVPGPALPGRAWIMVAAAQLTPSALRAAIAGGEFYASNGVMLEDMSHEGEEFIVLIKPTAMTPSHRLPPRYAIRFVGQGGQTLAVAAGTKAVYRFKGSEAYVRAVVTDSDGKMAWTQPVFLDKRKDQSPYGRTADSHGPDK